MCQFAYFELESAFSTPFAAVVANLARISNAVTEELCLFYVVVLCTYFTPLSLAVSAQVPMQSGLPTAVPDRHCYD